MTSTFASSTTPLSWTIATDACGNGGLAGTGGIAGSGGTGAASGKGGVVGTGGIVGTGGTMGAGGGSAVGTLSVLAGVPSGVGSADGTGVAARFYRPTGVAVDGVGNVFVADTYNNTIRKITPTGVVTTLAGTAGSPGSADGTGAGAAFSTPWAVAVDGAGNVFVADMGNSTVRKITPAGVVTTLAGTAGLSGSADGTGAAARFDRPLGVAVDVTGNVFVADAYNNAIRRITSSGAVSTIVGVADPTRMGNFPGPLPASMALPLGVAVDPSGSKLYITLPDAVMVAVLSK